MRSLPTRSLHAIPFAMFGWLALIAPATFAQGADDVVLTPQRISEHGWFFEGDAGMASAANKGFMSNAGFVVTGDGVIVFDAPPELRSALLRRK